MCGTVDTLVNVVANVATGGMYSLAKAGIKTIETGNPSALLTQGLDLGMASTGNQLSVDLGGPIAGQAFNAAGGLAGAAGAMGAFSGLPGFEAAGAGAGSTIAPSAAADTVAGANAGADIGAGPATWNGEVGAIPQGAEGLTVEAGGPAVSATTPAAVAGESFGPAQSFGPAMENGSYLSTMPADSATNPAAVKGWFDSLSPIAQGAIVMGAGQMATGSLGGLFQGVSADKKLALERLMNDQRQNQVQRLNKNNSYAPKVAFATPPAGPAGLLSTAGVK